MKLLRNILQKRKLPVITALITSVLSLLISLIWNQVLAKLINEISSGNRLSYPTLIYVFAIMLMMGVFMSLESYTSGYACEAINHDFRMWYIKRYLVKDAAKLEQLNAGKQLSKLQNELNEISGYISSQLFPLFNTLLKFTVTLSWLIYLNPRLALVSNLPVILIVLYIGYSSQIITKQAIRSQQENEHMNGMAQSMMSLFPVIRLYDAGTLMYEQYFSSISRWEDAGKKEERVKAALMSPSAMLSALPLLLLLLFGGMDVLHGVIPVGTLYLFINLSGNVSGVMMNMPGNIGAFRRFSANMERMEQHENNKSD